MRNREWVAKERIDQNNKMRYLTITSEDLFYAKEQITKEDLVQVLRGNVDHLLDLENGTYFDPNLNAWVKFTSNIPDHAKAA